MEMTLTLKVPEPLYERSRKLIEAGFFTDFEDLVRTGIRNVLLEWSVLEREVEPPGLTGPERMAYYLQKLRRQIAEAGGLFPGKTPEEVIEILRHTREQIHEEKYAAHFRQQRVHLRPEQP